MFDLSWTELLLIAVVALVAIGPKELPRVLYELGKWMRRAKLMAGEFQRHFNDMMHEAELSELRREAEKAREAAGGVRPRSLAELVDPDYAIRDALTPPPLDPTLSGAAGYAGSPPETGPEASPAPVAAPADETAPAAPAAAAEAEPSPAKQE